MLFLRLDIILDTIYVLVKSNGGAKTKFPDLMGIYKKSSRKENLFPEYDQVDGTGLIYENRGEWVVINTNDPNYPNGDFPFLMYSKVPTNPAHQLPSKKDWHYLDDGYEETDTTLTMLLLSPGLNMTFLFFVKFFFFD